jgi:glucans biosynthesis protein
MLSRRDTLVALAISSLASGKVFAALPKGTPGGTPFSWDVLKTLALQVADRPWSPPQPMAPAKLLTFNEVDRVEYRADKALWAGSGDTEARFFALNMAASQPVEINVVENGVSRPFVFTPELFNAKPDQSGNKPTPAPGFAGFRLMNAGGGGDWLAFQGASYFRTAGAQNQYGLSARGLAINTGIADREEFPIFTRFWLERGPGSTVTIYALMEGRSVTGAYRFVNRRTPNGPVQDVSLSIHLRADVARLGFAPLTSMFWYGEGNRAAAVDWRPEVHDSDGLAMFTGSGERIWRPLVNPQQPVINSFADKAPHGFGLLQRDRRFANYQDDGAFYEKRPNLWVEPKGDWGSGSVMLYEIPTHKETDDNIVTFWVPTAPAKQGATYELDYRLNWTNTDPVTPLMARAVDCWTGTAGPPGHDPIVGARRLVADFVGKNLTGLTRASGVEVDVTVSSGKILASYVYPVVGVPSCWRVVVDVEQDHRKPGVLRAYLKHGSDALSETLLYPLG